MKEFKVTVTDEELRVLEWDIYSVQEWIQNAISEKARRTMFGLVKQHTNLNPSKLSKEEVETEISKLTLDTAKKRTNEFVTKE